MNWTVVPRITGGLGCMLVLVLGIVSGSDPLLCSLRGFIGGMVGWVAGALWAYLMSQLPPPEMPASPSASPQEPPEPTEQQSPSS